MTQAERAWLRERRSATAAHWNLLTDMKGEHLAYASESKHPGTMALVPARIGFGGARGSSAGLHGRVRRHHGVRIFTANGRPERSGNRTEGCWPRHARTRYAGSALHRKYKIYLDHVGVAHVPEDYEDRLTEIFTGTFKHLRLFVLIPTTLPCRSWNATSNVTEVM
jgi:hypothetical protein